MDNVTLSYTLILLAALPRSNPIVNNTQKYDIAQFKTIISVSASPFSYNFTMRLRVFIVYQSTEQKILKLAVKG